MNTLDCTTPAQAAVLAAVIGERSYQDRKWGPIDQRKQQVGSYLTLMRVHLAEAEAAWARSTGDHEALDELRKVVAIGVACFEQHGVPSRMEYGTKPGFALHTHNTPPSRLAAYSTADLSEMLDRMTAAFNTVGTDKSFGTLITYTADELRAELASRAPQRPATATEKVVTFDEFVQYGRDNGGNIVNGMPWSFSYKGWAVTHENDQCYLINVPGAPSMGVSNKTLRFTPDQLLVIDASGMDPDGIYLMPAAAVAHHPV